MILPRHWRPTRKSQLASQSLIRTPPSRHRNFPTASDATTGWIRFATHGRNDERSLLVECGLARSSIQDGSQVDEAARYCHVVRLATPELGWAIGNDTFGPTAKSLSIPARFRGFMTEHKVRLDDELRGNGTR